MDEATLVVAEKQDGVGTLMRKASDVAGVCRQIVLSTSQQIGPKKYVKVEGWQSIAVAFGCVASIRSVEDVPGGISAVAEIRRMADGVALATAEGFVGDDEKTWASRPVFARRAMAQTRAISRACRSAFAFVVTMIDADLSTTPAEEMDAITVEPRALPAPSGVEGIKARMTKPAPPTPPGASKASRPHQLVTIKFGACKGKTSADISSRDLAWYIEQAQKSVDDPARAQYRVANLADLESLQAEASWREKVS